MSCCGTRALVLTICILQLIATFQRQVFDFLGYMWAPILGNFFQIIFVIFGFFGTYHYRPRYVAAYLVWTFAWIGWNVFVICLYMEVGFLNRDSSILNIGTGSRSWWEAHGFGCSAVFNFSSSDDILAVTKPVFVSGCLLEYYHVECIQAGVQCLLAVSVNACLPSVTVSDEARTTGRLFRMPSLRHVPVGLSQCFGCTRTLDILKTPKQCHRS
ncbi:unnamed protein product [Ixodes pacificus]